MVALFFVAVAAPIEVGLLETKLDALFWLNRLVDLVFACDMAMQFFLMYPVQTPFRQVLEYRHRRIVKHYLTGWFLPDFVSILPFDVVSVAFDMRDLHKVKII